MGETEPLVTAPRTPLFWTLRAIARLERTGLRPPRLTEHAQERWQRVRRKLGWVAFIELLHEDLAEAFPTSFALERWAAHPTTGLGDKAAQHALELPGCGGRIAAYQVTTHAGLSLHEHFTFVADTDAERVAIGLAAAAPRRRS
jgi:hypothetical protein